MGLVLVFELLVLFGNKTLQEGCQQYSESPSMGTDEDAHGVTVMEEGEEDPEEQIDREEDCTEFSPS